MTQAGYRGQFAVRTDLGNPTVGSEIHRVWAARTGDPWHVDPYYYRHLGELANRLGQPMFAIDILSEALRIFPGDVRLKQLFALAQIRCGFLTKARRLLTDLVNQGHKDEETLGILGRVYKELWQRAGEDPSHGDLRRSRNLYLKAFLRSRGYYSGINAATLSMVMGDRTNARKIARAVVGICRQALDKEPDYWAMATLGEASVLIDRQDDAAVWYQKAGPLIRRNLADIASTRRQLKLLSRHIDIRPELLDTLAIPNVVAFSGHLVDSPDRKRPRFPSQSAEEVKRRIAATLDELDAGIGYSSAGCGADVLFLECMQERGAECNVVLPFDREDFFRTSVDFAGSAWRKRTERALEQSSQVRQAAEGPYAGDDILFSYANRVIMGRAILRGRLLDTESVLLVVWKREKKRLVGGTAEFVKMWERRGRTARIVDISGLKAPDAEPMMSEPPHALVEAVHGTAPETRGLKRDTRALLFADIVGFSKLSEQQFPRFVDGLLGTLSRRQKRFRHKPVFKNIWGDAVYFVFEKVLAAAEHALDLRDMMRETDWANLGLPADLTMRIGLHAGPVYLAREPVLGRVNYYGRHVNHAARIEPITTPGNVYASEQFAALITAEPQDRIECNYVGEIVLPKDFGSHPIYLVNRKDELE